MRIAITGAGREGAVEKIENVFNSKAVKPEFVSESYPIIDYAAVTYVDYPDKRNVAFDGCVLDVIKDYTGEGYNDVIEQIAISSLSTLDQVVVITKDLTPEALKMYKEFADMLPDKFVLYHSEKDFEVTLV